MKFFVSRQKYWPDGECVVEVAAGGRDYANADMLVPKYAGEGEEYVGMTPAVEAAIAIAASWRSDCPELEIEVATGCTHGFSGWFEGEPNTHKLIEEAKAYDEKLPKCPQCGEIMGEAEWTLPDHCDDKYCSEHCAERAAEFYALLDNEARLDDLATEYELSDDDLAECFVVQKEWETYKGEHPQDEWHGWLISRIGKSWSEDEIKKNIEETYEHPSGDPAESASSS